MKGLMICLAASVFFLIMAGVASAECNNSEQTILRLSAEQNAHASLWDENSYIVRVCYDRYFAVYDGKKGDAAHECSSGLFGTGNRLFYSSDTSNAHASYDANDNYPIEVCHGGLSGCELKQNTGMNVCKGIGKEAIVFLSARTNAHVSRRYSSNYPWVICCKGIGSAPVINTPSVCAHYSDSNMFQSYYGAANCTKDALNISKLDPLCPAGEKTCRCIWTENQCALVYNDTSGDGCFYTCTKSVTDYDAASCNEGYKNVTVNALLRGVSPIGCIPDETIDDCQGTTTLIPCEFSLAELPFFGAWQFIATGMAIALIYFVAYRKKKS